MDVQWLEERLVRLEERSRCHDTDLYFGKGKEDPPLTQRVAALEQWLEEAKESAVSTKDDARQTRRMMIATMLSCFATVVAGFCLYLLTHGAK